MVGKGRRLLQVLLLSGVLSILAPPLLTHASGSWTTGTFEWGERKKVVSTNDSEQCQRTLMKIVGVTSLPESAQVCVYDRPNFRYAAYNKYINLGYGGYTQSYFVVSLGNDHDMYVVENMDGRRLPIDVPGSNDLHFNTLTMGFTNNHLLSYVPNFAEKLHRTTSFDQPTRYRLIDGAEQPFIPYDQMQTVITGAVGVSDNGDWMVAEVMGAGLIRIDTATRKIDGFSNYVHRYGVGGDAHITFRITNDGTKVAAFDYNISPIIYTLDTICLISTDSYNETFAEQLRTHSCSTDGSRLYNALTSRFTYQQTRGMSAAGFNTDGDVLYFNDYVYEDENDWMNPTIYQTPLYADGYIKESGIEYLALGDSFTSGEGDIEKQPDGSSYYLPGTAGKNECHTSRRSYPFLIRDEKAMDVARMHSVACSGAQVLPDYMGVSNTYLGQGNQLKGLSETKVNEARQAALTNFNPGQIPQLEFIKRYQPKVVTVMGGGNDVGFGNILQYCASPSWEMTIINDTCGYALEGNPLRAMFAQTIQSQYQYTLLLLRKIKQASPETTVYIVGYPSFISEEPSASCFNSAALDSNERVMINEGVVFMNTMLESAATSMGMHYLDIHDTLNGGRLCEGSEYVTGIVDVGLDKVVNNDTRELFHPNAKAHEKIAERILSQDFQAETGRNTEELSEPIDLTVPAYFAGTGQKQALRHSVTDDLVTEQAAIPVSVPNSSLAAGSSAKLTMYSDAVDLGEVLVNDEGGIDAYVALPASLKPGRHVLVLDGSSTSGEPLRYFQFVTIVSQTQGDSDSDGVPDTDDPCLFIVTWIDEATQQDICSLPTGQEESGGGGTPKSDEQLNSVSHPSTDDKYSLSSISQMSTSESSKSAHSDDSTTAAKPEVLGALTQSKQNTNKTKNAESHNWLIGGSIVVLSTLLFVYAIVRLLRRGI